MLSDDEIIAEIRRYPALHVVLTGGEPCMQVTYDLVDKIKATGRFVQIETNGKYRLDYVFPKRGR